MKFNKIHLLLLFVALAYGCKKDLGNYTYHSPVDPICDIAAKTFPAIEGDSLILRPQVLYAGGNILKDLTYKWEITFVDSLRTDVYYGYPLRMVYNLPPGVRGARLTITAKATGIQYFYTFNINGITQYSLGTAVLSVDGGVTKFTFVEPDNKTMQADIYAALNKQILPANPVELYAHHYPLQTGNKGVDQYWIMCNDPAKGSVIVDATTLLKKGDFKSQFLSPPTTIIPGHFEDSLGVTNGVINGKLWFGITSTAFFATDYGKFGGPQLGNYTMSPFFMQTWGYTFGFDTTAGAFISFDGGGGFHGSDYVVDGDAFDPTNTGMHNLLYMQPKPGTTYAFLKADNGTIYEYSFLVSLDDYNNRTISPQYKRVFAGASLVQPDTKWQTTIDNIFYFTSNNAIYRYNPLNQDLRTLNTDMGGKKVTMLKLSADGKTLMAGVDGQIYFIDVRIGNDGSTFTQPTISGIPGTPVGAITLQ